MAMLDIRRREGGRETLQPATPTSYSTLAPQCPPCPRRHLGTYPSSHAAIVRMAKRTAVAKVELRARRRGVQSRKCNLKPRRKGNTEEEQEEPHVRNAAR